MRNAYSIVNTTEATPSNTASSFNVRGGKSNVDANTITTLAKISAAIRRSQALASREVPLWGSMVSKIFWRRLISLLLLCALSADYATAPLSTQASAASRPKS